MGEGGVQRGTRAANMRAVVAACLVLSPRAVAADKPTLAAAKAAAHESATACEHHTADGLRHHIALTAAGLPVDEVSGWITSHICWS